MRHRASPEFWARFDDLAPTDQAAARRAFGLLDRDASHPSLHFKSVGEGLWSARIDLTTRALARKVGDDYLWVWIGPHDEYERRIR